MYPGPCRDVASLPLYMGWGLLSYVMATDATSAADAGPTPEVMASVEAAGAEPRLVIADISRDDAWVSAPTEAARGLEAWR